MEIIEGILNNQNSKNQSLLFIRDLNCVDEKMRKDNAAFYNKKESEDRDLESLKERAINKLSKENVFRLKVKKDYKSSIVILTFFNNIAPIVP